MQFFYNVAWWKGRYSPFIGVVGVSPPHALRAFDQLLDRNDPRISTSVDKHVLTEYGLSLLMPDQTARDSIVHEVYGSGWARLPTQDLVSDVTDMAPLRLPDGYEVRRCLECSPTHAIVASDERSWLCTRFFYVPWHGLPPLDELVLYAGLSLKRAVDVLCGNPEGEVVPCWSD